MTSRERVRAAAVEAGWRTTSDQRAPWNRMILICRTQAGNPHRLVIWFSADDRVLSADHEFGDGQHTRLDPGVDEVLWHVTFWGAL